MDIDFILSRGDAAPILPSVNNRHFASFVSIPNVYTSSIIGEVISDQLYTISLRRVFTVLADDLDIFLLLMLGDDF